MTCDPGLEKSLFTSGRWGLSDLAITGSFRHFKCYWSKWLKFWQSDESLRVTLVMHLVTSQNCNNERLVLMHKHEKTFSESINKSVSLSVWCNLCLSVSFSAAVCYSLLLFLLLVVFHPPALSSAFQSEDFVVQCLFRQTGLRLSIFSCLNPDIGQIRIQNDPLNVCFCVEVYLQCVAVVSLGLLWCWISVLPQKHSLFQSV